jgi:hypothetical protein
MKEEAGVCLAVFERLVSFRQARDLAYDGSERSLTRPGGKTCADESSDLTGFKCDFYIGQYVQQISKISSSLHLSIHLVYT